MTECIFVKAQSDNLPKIGAFMMTIYFASNPDFTSAEVKGVKAARIIILPAGTRPQVVSTILRHLGSIFHRGPNVFHPVPHVHVPVTHRLATTNHGPCHSGKKALEMKHRDEWIVIGISGVTCGGKTSLANQLNQKLSPVYLFHQDKYFYPDDSPHHVKCENLDHNNYDILSALDMEAMYKDICSTIEGNNKSHFATMHDGEHIFKIPNKKFLIIEGFTVLNYEPIMKLCNLSYYFVLEYGECASRRCYRVYEPPDVPGYFEQCVWPEHLKYRAMIEKDPRVTILDGIAPNSLEIVMTNLKTMTDKKT